MGVCPQCQGQAPGAHTWGPPVCMPRSEVTGARGCFFSKRSCGCIRKTAISTSVTHSVVSHSLRPHALWPPGSSVHGILQARTLDWVALTSSRESSRPRNNNNSKRFSKVWPGVVSSAHLASGCICLEQPAGERKSPTWLPHPQVQAECKCRACFPPGFPGVGPGP